MLRIYLTIYGPMSALLTQFPPDLPGEARPRRFLDDLLVAALDGAVPLEEVDVVPVLVPEHLHLRYKAYKISFLNEKFTSYKLR